MNLNIKILTQNCCEDLLTFTSRPMLRKEYNNDKYDATKLEFLNLTTKYFMDDAIELGISSKDDCQSSITIFKQLMNLDRVQANDKRLWVSLTHTTFFDYTRKRWNIDSDTSDDTITSRFHFEGSGIEARMRNSIARLWWTAKVTYDESREDNFELTKLIWEKQDIHVAIMERSYGTYAKFVQGFLEFYKINKQLKEDELRTLLKGLNSVGGVKVLPILSKKDVIEEIKRIADFGKIEVN